MCESDAEYSPSKPRTRARNNTGDREKLKGLLLSPTGETGGHRLRSRTHINYAVSTPTEDDYSQRSDSPAKETRELRSSSRLLTKAAEKEKQESEQKTWESGRPKRSCILNKKRISADERLVVDNRTYYKVEVMLNKLRSSGLTARDQELLKQHRSPSPEKKSKETVDDKGLIVKFRKIRNAELTYLNNEAENFLFPKKEDSSDEDPDADGPNTTVSSNRHESSNLLSSETEETETHNHRKRTSRIKAEDDSAMDGFSNELSSPKRKGRYDFKSRLAKVKVEDEASIDSNFSEVSNSRRKDDRTIQKDLVTDDGSMDSTCSETKKKRRRTHAEAFIMDNQKYYKFETPGSRLRYQGTFLPPVTSTSRISPSKNNGESLVKAENSTTLQKSLINLDELQYSFEMIPEKEPWYEAFRRQDTGEISYLSLNDIDYNKPFLLPYQLPPLPPLDPKVCIAEYKLQQKLTEPASTSRAQEQNNASSEHESNAIVTEDSKASTSTSEDIKLELLNMIKNPRRSSKLKKRRYVVPGRNPRKSPRQHASTLAILSSLVHRKRKGDLNASRSSSDLNDSRQKLSMIKEDKQEDYEEIERGIEKMFEEEDDKLVQDLTSIPVHQGIDIRCIPDAIETLQSYEDLKNKETKKTTSTRRLLNGSTFRKPGRKKKKTNKTGWPNRNRRNALRNKDTCSTKDEEEEAQPADMEEDEEVEEEEKEKEKDKGREKPKEKVNCTTPVKNIIELNSKWDETEKEIVAKINNCELLPIVRVQKLDSEVMVRHKRSFSVDVSPPNTERRAKRTQSSPKSPRALRKPRGRWYKER